MKIKFNEEKQTFSIRGLSGVHLDILYKIMQNVRLGSDNTWKEYALDLVELFDRSINRDMPDSGLLVYFTEEDGLGVIELIDDSDGLSLIDPGQFIAGEEPDPDQSV